MNAQTNWKLDAAHSKVSFNISHMVISEVTGRFTDFDINLTQTKDDFAESKITATIKTKSINTDNEGRDKHLRSTDFFDAEKYPEITFKSMSFEKTGKDSYKITGDLTMHGVTKSVVMSTKFNGTMVDPWGNTRAGFKAEGTINRKDFGIVYNKVLETGGVMLGEDVGIIINVEMTKEKK
ncbi:MAG: polyisoprenoid-binding protein [Ignavibacteriales bacterium]|nr:polyisoprenoid-binding protein [Ignavibacteriales bacterium]